MLIRRNEPPVQLLIPKTVQPIQKLDYRAPATSKKLHAVSESVQKLREGIKKQYLESQGSLIGNILNGNIEEDTKRNALLDQLIEKEPKLGPLLKTSDVMKMLDTKKLTDEQARKLSIMQNFQMRNLAIYAMLSDTKKEELALLIARKEIELMKANADMNPPAGGPPLAPQPDPGEHSVAEEFYRLAQIADGSGPEVQQQVANTIENNTEVVAQQLGQATSSRQAEQQQQIAPDRIIENVEKEIEKYRDVAEKEKKYLGISAIQFLSMDQETKVNNVDKYVKLLSHFLRVYAFRGERIQLASKEFSQRTVMEFLSPWIPSDQKPSPEDYLKQYNALKNDTFFEAIATLFADAESDPEFYQVPQIPTAEVQQKVQQKSKGKEKEEPRRSMRLGKKPPANEREQKEKKKEEIEDKGKSGSKTKMDKTTKDLEDELLTQFYTDIGKELADVIGFSAKGVIEDTELQVKIELPNYYKVLSILKNIYETYGMKPGNKHLTSKAWSLLQGEFRIILAFHSPKTNLKPKDDRYNDARKFIETTNLSSALKADIKSITDKLIRLATELSPYINDPNNKNIKTARGLKSKKRGQGIQVYTNKDDLLRRLKVLLGECQAGNNSKKVRNEIAQLADKLKEMKVIKASIYNGIYAKYVR